LGQDTSCGCEQHHQTALERSNVHTNSKKVTNKKSVFGYWSVEVTDM
jgi:hypothetical protein